ncbi:LysM peptidoglycan-binding domain-containing protein [Dyella solisilvae]|uniref:LysM peptidoglycan-binding domain-containing protein n=1 Tax=Dyella solisilvae TaxID=1920168 RepID=A0A370K6A8_9GAMM|nr:transglycosylase SLT domain-containing protein [Dyella solisilvae]RDI98172.1 LysM peptidoglycan-binding domain-containing protein [Dyella solisilvae]
MAPHAYFRSLRLAPLAGAIMLLAACASSGAAKPTAQASDLYAQLDQASKGYETAVAQARAGNTQASQKTLAAALDQLKVASAHCSSTPGCDPQRFFSVFDRLLRLKDSNFALGDDVDGMDDDPPEGSSGKSGAASLPEAQRSVTLLHGQQLSQLIAMNGPVKAALEMWLTQWRGNLMDAYVNYQFLRYQMWPEYQRQDLPEALLFGIMAKESGGKVHAVSRSGAAGPLQFMYATGLRFGLTTEDGFDSRFDPAASARANAEYMNEQLRAFNDNLELTLAAYNGGEGRMRRLVGDNTAVSLYDPVIYNQLSQETRDYVPAVLAAAWLFLHPESYNLRFPRVDGAQGSIVLSRPASLTELTVCLGSAGGMSDGWFRTLRNLNPRLDPQAAQPTGTRIIVPKLLERPYGARCVDGPWPILANDLHTAVLPVVPATPAPPPAPSRSSGSGKARSYTVRRGDTLTSIVNRLGCSSVQEVAEMNGLSQQHIKPGQTLKLPSCR